MTNVRVAERGRRSRLLLEPLDARGILDQIGGQELQRHPASETHLGGEPHLAHPARPERPHDVVASRREPGLRACLSVDPDYTLRAGRCG